MAVIVKCSRPSQTDVIFVAMNDLAEKENVEVLITIQDVTVKSHPCVVDLTCCFSESFVSGLHPWLPN